MNEGPSGPSVITSPSYRIEDSSAEGPLGPTVTHPLATASKMLLLKARQDRHSFHLLDIYYYISTYNAIKEQKSGTLSNMIDQ